MSTLDRDMLPPLPKIEGDVDLLLTVYTHHSLRPNGTPMYSDYGDTERLPELGSKILDMTVTYHLFSATPMMDTEAIKIQRAAIIRDENINAWLDAYGLKDKLRIAPDHVQVLENPREMRRYFYMYIGALFIRSGLAPIQTWISWLIDPSVDVMLPDSAPQSQDSPSSSPSQAGVGSYGTPPSDPSSPDSLLPGSNPVVVSTSITLALVNETVIQSGAKVTYRTEKSGSSHEPIWTVGYCLDGHEYGRGTGRSQKKAKEEAARKAWMAKGWGS